VPAVVSCLPTLVVTRLIVSVTKLPLIYVVSRLVTVQYKIRAAVNRSAVRTDEDLILD